METVLLWYGESMKELDKDNLFSFFASKSLKNICGIMWYNKDLKAFYQGIDDIILNHLNQILGIQIYKDNVIRYI